jgi:hypothetical protein
MMPNGSATAKRPSTSSAPPFKSNSSGRSKLSQPPTQADESTNALVAVDRAVEAFIDDPSIVTESLWGSTPMMTLLMDALALP